MPQTKEREEKKTQANVSEVLVTPEPNSFYAIVSEARIKVSNAIEQKYEPSSDTIVSLFFEVLGEGYYIRAHKGREGTFQVEIEHTDGDRTKFTIP